MASEQTSTNEAIAQIMAVATRVAIQAIALTRPERTQNVGPRLGGPMMKEPTFNWEAEDKYNELKNFRLEVNHISKSYNMPQTEQIAIIKTGLAERPTMSRISNTEGTRKMPTGQCCSYCCSSHPAGQGVWSGARSTT